MAESTARCCPGRFCKRVGRKDEAYLSHGNESELAILYSVVDLSGIGLNLLARGVAREEDEEDGSAGGGLAHDHRRTESILVDVPAAHGFLTEVLQKDNSFR